MAQEMRHALRVAENLLLLYNEPHSRIWLPRLSLSWLGVPPRPLIAEDVAPPPPMPDSSANSVFEGETCVSRSERKQGVAEQRFALGRMRSIELEEQLGEGEKAKRRLSDLVTYTSTFFMWLWSNDTTLQLRIRLWSFHRSLKGSSHLRHALKNAVGVALLTFPAFMPAESHGKQYRMDIATLVLT